uniref:Uncharacterized protein n=1 Tax=Romanomermis culicivorax TaxID=13658 RepID=A0A915JPK1_ROMCU
MTETIRRYFFTIFLIVCSFYDSTIPSAIKRSKMTANDLCPVDQCFCFGDDQDENPNMEVLCDRGGLNDKSLHKLLQKIPKNVKFLEISGQKLDENHFTLTQDLVKFKSLEKLTLSTCNLPSLGKRTLEALKSLKSLELPRNNIDTLSPDTFVNLDNLEHLDLSQNKLANQILATGTFVHLKNLQSINLSRNFLRFFANNLFSGLSNLKYLDMSFNFYQKSNDFNLLRDLPDLESLNLYSCEIRHLPKNVFIFNKKLKRLNLGGNLFENPLELREIFDEMPQLEHLDLSYCNLTKLPDNFFAKLVNLKSLNLAGNFPENFQKIFGSEIRLQHLNISDSNFNDFDANILGQFNESLTTLDLSKNPLSTMNHNQTSNLKCLRFLYISNVKIRILPIDVPREYANLEILDISHNNIDFMPYDFLKSLISIRKLDISSNKLTYLPYFFENVVKSSPKLTINFADNPWNCDCQTISIIQNYFFRESPREIWRQNVTCSKNRNLVIFLNRPTECSTAYLKSSKSLHETISFQLLIAAMCGAVLVAGFLIALTYNLLCSPRASYHTNEEKMNLSTTISTTFSGTTGGDRGGTSPNSSNNNDEQLSDVSSEKNAENMHNVPLFEPLCR